MIWGYNIIYASTVLYRKAVIRSWWVFIVEIHDRDVVHFTNKFNTHFDRLCTAKISYIPIRDIISIMIRHQKYWARKNFAWIFYLELFFLCGEIYFDCSYTEVIIDTFLRVCEFLVFSSNFFD